MITWARADVLSRRVLDGVVLMTLEGESVSLNPTATALWEFLRDPLDELSLTLRAADMYEVDPGEISGEVDAFLADMGTRGFLRSIVI